MHSCRCSSLFWWIRSNLDVVLTSNWNRLLCSSAAERIFTSTLVIYFSLRNHCKRSYFALDIHICGRCTLAIAYYFGNHFSTAVGPDFSSSKMALFCFSLGLGAYGVFRITVPFRGIWLDKDRIFAGRFAIQINCKCGRRCRVIFRNSSSRSCFPFSYPKEVSS